VASCRWVRFFKSAVKPELGSYRKNTDYRKAGGAGFSRFQPCLGPAVAPQPSAIKGETSKLGSYRKNPVDLIPQSESKFQLHLVEPD
jgi:hypothetical protein